VSGLDIAETADLSTPLPLHFTQGQGSVEMTTFFNELWSEDC
jgi:hypothetical protein